MSGLVAVSMGGCQILLETGYSALSHGAGESSGVAIKYMLFKEEKPNKEIAGQKQAVWNWYVQYSY